MPQGQAGMREARKRYNAANPDVARKNIESAKASYQRNHDTALKRKRELRDQRFATLRQFAIARGSL